MFNIKEKEKELYDILKNNCKTVDYFIITYKVIVNGIINYTELCDYAISDLNRNICAIDVIYRNEKYMHGNTGPSISKARKIKNIKIHNITLIKNRIKTIASELNLKLDNDYMA